MVAGGAERRRQSAGDRLYGVPPTEYRRVGDGQETSSDQLAAQTEAALLREFVHADRASWTRKIVPVLLPGSTVAEVPLFLQPSSANCVWGEELTVAGARDLLGELTSRPAHVMPALASARPVSPEPAQAVVLASDAATYRAVRDRCQEVTGERDIRGTLFERGALGGWVVWLAQIAPGDPSGALHLELTTAYLGAQLVVLIGVAWGVGGVGPGHVVIADYVYDHEASEDTDAGRLARIKTTAPSYQLVQWAQQVARQDGWTDHEPAPRVLVGPIAAGAKTVTGSRSDPRRWIAEHCGDALAVDIGGHGFLHAAYVTPRVEALVIRGIATVVGEAEPVKPSSAVDNAAAFAAALLSVLTTPRC